MRVGSAGIVLCAFATFVHHLIDFSELRHMVYVLGNDVAMLTLCAMLFHSIDPRRVAFRAVTSVFSAFVTASFVCNLYTYVIGYDERIYTVWMVILGLLLVVIVPITTLRMSLREGVSEKPGCIHLVLRRPTSVTGYLFSSLTHPCTSCSVLINDDWYTYRKTSGVLTRSHHHLIDTRRYMIIPTRYTVDAFDVGLLDHMVSDGYRYSRLAHNCCKTFWFLFERHGLAFSPLLHLIPTLFAHRVLNHDAEA